MTSALHLKAIAICAVVIVTACAPTSKYPEIDAALAEEEAHRQRLQTVEAYVNNVNRLADVSYPILKENTLFCGELVKAYRGIVPFTLDVAERDWRGAYRERFGITNAISVLGVTDGSPADLAGLEYGDRIVGVDGEDIGTGEVAYHRLFDIFQEDNHQAIAFTIERGGEKRELIIGAATVCSHPVQLVYDDSVNAWADGLGIHITTGMMRFAADDDELAFVIGHELAHNTRRHIEMQMANRAIGSVLGAVLSVAVGVNVTQIGADAGTMAFSQEFEAEADYVGIYHAARAGYDVTDAAEFWRRMAEAHPSAINLVGSTHPSTAKRYLAVKTAAEEIAAKREAGQPLIPEERE